MTFDTSKEVKTNARKAFDQRNYKKAFSTLFSLGIDDFVKYAEKEIKRNLKHNFKKKVNWFLDKEASDYLWDEFFVDEAIFISVFSSTQADQILHYYFYKKVKQYPTFELKLSKAFPQLYIRNIRLNQIFLRKDRINFLLEKVELPEKYSAHQVCWKYMNQTENELWEKVQKTKDEIGTFDIKAALVQSSIWLEEQRFSQNRNDNYQLQVLSAVYSLYAEMIYPELIKDSLFPNEKELAAYFFPKLQSPQKSKYHVLLNDIDDWYQYYSVYVLSYCFDLDFLPVLENESLYLWEPPLSHYQFQVDGLRYSINDMRYEILSDALITNIELQNPKIIPAGGSFSYEGNRDITLKTEKGKMLLKDLAIDKLCVCGREYDVNQLVEPIRAYASNRKLRYIEAMQNHSSQGENWKKAFVSVLKESVQKGINNLPAPFEYKSVAHFFHLNSKVFPQLSEEANRDMLQYFSYQGDHNRQFDRFNLKYDVNIRPFLKFDDFVFSPMVFFANNDWFYSAVQATLLQNSRAKDKNETENMENILLETFKNQFDWDVNWTGQNKLSSMNGDIDIHLNDGIDSLFLQMKRPRFRLNPKEKYYEYLNDIKGAKQLNDAEDSLNQQDSLSSQPIKWLLSSSYEGIGKNIDGCRKVNYFDLLHAIRFKKFNSIRELFSYISNETELKSFIKNNESLSTGLNFIIPRYTEKAKLFLFTSHSAHAKNNRRLFNSGLELNKSAKNIDSLRYLKSYLKITLEDFETLGAIANVYADMRDFENANKYFEKATRLSLFEPDIVRNHISSLCESGDFVKAEQLFLELCRKYPVMDFSDIERFLQSCQKRRNSIGNINVN